MKILIILICLLISTGANAQDTEVGTEVKEQEKTEVKKQKKTKLSEQEKIIVNNYYGVNLVYNMATLNDPGTNVIDPQIKKNGFGFDLFYQSFISGGFSYKVLFEFIYNSFPNKIASDIPNYPLEPGIQQNYTQEERFYNFLGGFIFSYYIYFEKFFTVSNSFLKYIFPYFSTGLMASTIYKNFKYTYDKEPIDFTDTKSESQWLSTALTIPFCFGINFKINPAHVINLNFTYLLINFDETSKKFGYKNIMNFKLGYMRPFGFKL